jgi:hypothetical protein
VLVESYQVRRMVFEYPELTRSHSYLTDAQSKWDQNDSRRRSACSSRISSTSSSRGWQVRFYLCARHTSV